MEKRVRITRIFILIVILLQMLLMVGSSATDSDIQRNFTPNASHEFILDALTWKAYIVDCSEGTFLSGSFEVSCEGDLYPGDQQKYDDWAPHYIQFYILNESEYAMFVERELFTPSFVQKGESNLDWQFEITATGRWYIVYYNATIYMMIVNGTFNQPSEMSTLFLVIIILSSSLIVMGVFRHVRKRV